MKTYGFVRSLSTDSLISPMKIRKVLTVMLCVLIFAAVFAVAVPTNVGADNPVTIYVDTSGIDARTDLTDEQKRQLKDCIVADIQANFDKAVGKGKVEVTRDPAKEAGSARQVRITNDTGTHTKPDGTTGYHYGKWKRKATEVDVYLGNFMDRHGDDYKTGGQWNITKLNNGIGRTSAHELGHSFSLGHNSQNVSEYQTKMTDGGLVTSQDRANETWLFHEFAISILKKNLDYGPCNSTIEIPIPYLYAHFDGGPDLPYDPDDWGAVDALFSFSGPNASEFELGWYGVDTDNGVNDGSSDFDFIYKTSMLPDPEQNAEMITFFEGITDKVQFLLRGAPGSPWEGQWFLLDEENVMLENFVETPDGDVVARIVMMGWDIDGEPGLDVQITLDANAFGNYSNPYNGFTYSRERGVGGIVIPVDKLALLAPYIALTSTIIAATVATAIYVKRVKRRKEKQ